ncbi:beta-lactamase family protein [Corynebacterium uropygiale]|uniref:Beta-lactamase family protein n=1 Tax=Corynebacterium uropygiale TaxID=1775911 RepID=A0A9X1QRG5_9CORY|nr:serine hydrolase domain-containing protein [Corynebacterium uropygiale]MCF4006209.1 beta-lactamase family protein [Corynebacterium uropygiale]
MDSLDALTTFPAPTVAAAVLDHSEQWTLGDEEHVFALASVTKLLTAYAVLLAVEEGAMELDDPLGPEGSTVRHLLAHASGVGFDSRRAQKPVGERRIYSSAGYEILAEAVAEATGIDFPEYLREGVCEPLGMSATRLERSAGHGAVSTVRDLAVFAREWLTPTLLHPDTVAEALHPQFPELRGVVPGYGMQKPCLWGLGPEIRGEKEPHWTGANMPEDTAGHFGMSGTYLWFHRPTQRAMVMLSDRDFGPWAKPLWSETNAAIWAELSSSTRE